MFISFYKSCVCVCVFCGVEVCSGTNSECHPGGEGQGQGGGWGGGGATADVRSLTVALLFKSYFAAS